MKKHPELKIMAITAVFLCQLLTLDGQYLNQAQLSARVRKLGSEYPGLCNVRALTNTSAGNPVWLLTVGTTDPDAKPGIAIVGGVDGRYLFGRELACGFAEKLLKSSGENDIKELLKKVTFYILPDVSPDATAQYFGKPVYERSINARSTDDDRDFLTDEDPAEDINNDGLITLIRVKDPAGEYIESNEDKRIMVKADLSKGETGTYLVYSEGTDNDKDGSFNEDGEGGVSFNRNFTYNYEEFGRNSGQYPISEPEVKAVADFLFDRFNIYAVFTFGPQDNLGQPMKAADRPESARNPSQAASQNAPPDQGMMRRDRGRITSVMKTDEIINKLVSDKYHAVTGLKGVPPAVSEPGNFMEWAYYHYGRYSFSSPGWWLSVEKGKNPESEYLKFAGKKNIPDVFVPWTKIDHPDFPGKMTEVGGIKPFAMFDPPADTIASLTDSHFRFITEIAEMHPELEFLDITTENAGENIFRISLKVHNKGIFATCAEIGDQNIWTRIMRITVEPSGSQELISGTKVQRIQRLQGDESAEFTWLISGRGKTKITAGAANTGFISAILDLK
jgi:hypothetical protein